MTHAIDRTVNVTATLQLFGESVQMHD